MASDSEASGKSGGFDARVLEQLACPVCFGALRLDSPGEQGKQIICVECRRVYPLIDGIPVLIPARASFSEDSPKRS
jgi:uncharacterized protein YbaR (Trm112 family)